ncbi:prolactin regulatory element-binding protein-like [Liolophura sinensis]|uniref:prolactin regulatory element-binding protein-like n=1 Tax=Liolophura sinensis TaxID=3198878 RepID=UPI003158FE6D
MAPEKGSLLAKVDYPLYTVRSLGDRYFVVAGGGGSAKTGVCNAISVFELKSVGDSCLASCVHSHDTGSQATMNSSAFYDGRNHVYAAGMDDECHLFSLKYKVITPGKKKNNDSEGKEGARKRRESGKDIQTTNDITKQVTFEIQKLKHIKTDFAKEGSFQKVVQFNKCQSLLGTGGADGFVRIWKYPDLKKMHEIKAHDNEIDDLDFTPDGKQLVSVSRDKNAYIWSTKDGKRHTGLVWPAKHSDKYRYRACRYGVVSDKDKVNLYTIHIPCKRDVKPLPCFLSLWDSSTYRVKRVSQTGTEILSALSVSDDGIYIGVGTISGSVSVYIAFSLQRLYHIKAAHGIFVTGLEFMPSSEGSRQITGGQDLTLLSISADNTIKIHQVAARGSYSILWVIVGFLVIICLFFWLIATLGL